MLEAPSPMIGPPAEMVIDRNNIEIIRRSLDLERNESENLLDNECRGMGSVVQSKGSR